MNINNYKPSLEDILYAGVFFKNLKQMKEVYKTEVIIMSLMFLLIVFVIIVGLGVSIHELSISDKTYIILLVVSFLSFLYFIKMLINNENQEYLYYSNLLREYKSINKSKYEEYFKIIWDVDRFYKLNLHENVIRDMYYHPKKYSAIMKYRDVSDSNLFAEINDIYFKEVV